MGQTDVEQARYLASDSHGYACFLLLRHVFYMRVIVLDNG
jgi:hypothetical protein